MICELPPLRREERRDEEKEMQIARELAAQVVAKGYDLKSSPDAYHKVFQWIGQYRAAAENKTLTPPQKGLLLMGPPGRGKTYAARFISHFCQIQFWTMKRIDEEWGIDPEGCKQYFDNLFRDLYEPTIIDDLGAESMTKHFNIAPVHEFLLPFIYDRWTTYHKLFIVTTNLTLYTKDADRSIEGMYGPRIKSRFLEMFDVVKFDGPDRRAIQK